jgi:glutamate synthase domain-containing protein 3
VEGAGDHVCEYMTGGTVVVLGECGRNVGAGMSGGELYVYDPDARLEMRLNDQLVEATPVVAPAELRAVLEQHVRSTGSARAAALLERWAEAVTSFRRVAPRAEVAALQSADEGTVAAGG